MITDATFSNFKSIRKLEGLKLKPLTLLTGKNSSGKSNIMEAIYFFGQASRLQENPDIRQFDFNTVFQQGEIRYPRTLENYIVFKKNAELIINFEINIKIDKHESNIIKSILDDLIKYSFLPRFVIENKIQTIGYSYAFNIDRTFFSQKIFIDNHKLFEVSEIDRQTPKLTYPNLKVYLSGSPRNILQQNVFIPSGGSSDIVEVLQKLPPEIIRILKEKTKRIYFISGERGKIGAEKNLRERKDRYTPTWIGHNSQYLIEILSDCFTIKPEKSRKIKKWADKFQLMDVRAGYRVKNILESNFRDDLLNVDLNSNLAGLGARQLLSIITQIFYSEPDDVIMIEEPEISLHPENQVLLHELFADAISEGKQIICSTHSPFFVLALSKIVKKKLLKVEDIAVYHVKKTKKGTEAIELQLNKNGFIDGGVQSFMKVEAELFQDWSESLEEEDLKVE